MQLTPLLVLGLAPVHSLAASAVLYATHYSGTLSVLSLTDGNLTIASSEKNCGIMPSWVTFDAQAQVLYCVDEFNYGGTLNAFDVAADGSLTATASAKLLGNPVYSSLYGGPNNNSFQAIAH